MLYNAVSIYFHIRHTLLSVNWCKGFLYGRAEIVLLRFCCFLVFKEKRRPVEVNLFVYIVAIYCPILYSQTSLSRPFTAVNSCGPFMEVVGLQNFPKYRKDTILLFRFCEKLVGIGKG